MTTESTDLRQAAIDAAASAFMTAPVGPILSDTSNLDDAIEDAVDAALATLAGDLYIADDPGLPSGFGAVWAPDEEKCQAHELHVRGPVWALLAAVIPSREDAS